MRRCPDGDVATALVGDDNSVSRGSVFEHGMHIRLSLGQEVAHLDYKGQVIADFVHDSVCGGYEEVAACVDPHLVERGDGLRTGEYRICGGTATKCASDCCSLCAWYKVRWARVPLFCGCTLDWIVIDDLL